jgi:hypothetical protein
MDTSIRSINKLALTRWRLEAAFKSDAEFAKSIGLDGSKWSLVLSGKRRAQADEAMRAAEALKIRPADVFAALGIQYASPLSDNILKITASVIDGDIVTIYDEDADDFGSEEIEIPFLAYMGLGILIKTDTLAPRYYRGEVIGAGIDDEDLYDYDLESATGRDAVVFMPDGAVLLKTIHRVDGIDGCVLTSINPSLPPIIGAHPWGISLVDFRFGAALRGRKFR